MRDDLMIRVGEQGGLRREEDELEA